MSKITKSVTALGGLVALMGCANPEPEEVVIVEPAPVVVEQPSGKF
ncbi:MAG: hypothetical protein AAF390_01160 [Pseudomonadota bacterium]